MIAKSICVPRPLLDGTKVAAGMRLPAGRDPVMALLRRRGVASRTALGRYKAVQHAAGPLYESGQPQRRARCTSTATCTSDGHGLAEPAGSWQRSPKKQNLRAASAAVVAAMQTLSACEACTCV